VRAKGSFSLPESTMGMAPSIFLATPVHRPLPLILVTGLAALLSRGAKRLVRHAGATGLRGAETSFR
jgi:hypothetical protein